MKQRAIAASVILLSLVLPGRAAGGAEFLKVLTYNIQGMRPGSDPSTRLFFIIQNLKRIDPDIIALQEINESKAGGGADNQARAIAESLSVYFGIPYFSYVSATHEAWDGQFIESIGIVTKHAVLDSGFRDLEVAEFPRKVVWNLIQTPRGPVNFFTTHLSYSNSAVRVRQAGQVKDFMTVQEAVHPSVAAIVTGDFNDEPGSGTLQVFTGGIGDTSFYDTYSSANPASAGYTVDASAPTRRIDFILYRKSGELAIESSAVEIATPYSPGKFCSDHLAVLSTFSTRRLSAPRLINFPTLLLGSTDTTTFVLRNLSTQPVTIHSVEARTGCFRVLGTSQLPVTLPTRNSSTTFALEFPPKATGICTDTIDVSSDDPSFPTSAIPVRGRAIASVTMPETARCYAVSSTARASHLWTLDLSTGLSTKVATMDILSLAAFTMRHATGELIAVSSDSSASHIYRVSADSGFCVPLMALPIPGVRAMAATRGDTLLAGTLDGRILRVNLADGAATQIGRVQGGYGVGALCYDPGTGQCWATLYASPFTNDSLFVLNPSSGEMQLVGSSGQMIVTSAMAVDTSGVLYGLTGTTLSLLLRIDRLNGAGDPVGFEAYENFVGLAIRWPLQVVGIETVELGMPTRYALSQNYPNPFNGETVIEYTLPEESAVHLEVCTILGEAVSVPLHTRQPVGRYSLRVNASSLPSGVYIYRLRAGRFADARKMVLVR